MPHASSREEVRHPVGWLTSRPPTTMAHGGPKPAPALTPMLLTGQAFPEPYNRKHQKAQQSHRPALPSCGSGWQCAEATRSCWAPAQPTHSPGHRRRHQKARWRRCLAHSTVRHFSGASWLEGGSEKGKRNGEEQTTHSLRDTQWAFLLRGWSAVWAPGLSSELYNPARPRSWHVAASGQGLKLQAFVPFLYMSHHTDSLFPWP